MTRYVRLLMGLAVLAAIYWQIGGFGPDSADTSLKPSSSSPEDSTAAATDDSVSAALGGPDDGPAFGYAPTRAHGFETAIEDGLNASPVDTFSHWEEITIGRNESFYVALQRAGLRHETIMRVVKAAEEHTDLRKVRRGDRFLLAREDDDGGEGALRALRFDLDAEHYLVVRARAADEPFECEVADYPVEQLIKAAQGVIRTNLFDALKAGGADVTLADQLAEILGWDIDFFRDLRVGDEFVIVYGDYVHDGVSVRDPQILAVRFVNAGKEVRAYRSANEFGLPAYYRGDGSSLERQFLRAPLKFTRISSNFSHRRLHPVLKRYRPHYGVDYAAPKGTPVFATADGVVIKRTRDKASGRFVGVRHGNGYETYYLHLSGFAKSLSEGARVKQGQVLGFVGSTGWSTAPHLDYRIKKNGKWINPRKLSLPPADPVKEEDLPAFAGLVAEFDALIATVPADASTLVLSGAAANAPITR